MLAPSGGPTDELPEDRTRDAWPALREAQLSALSLNATALIYPIDLDDDGKTIYTPPSSRHGGLHPRNKTAFGRRLALAIAEAEGWLPVGVLASGPRVVASALNAGGVQLTFSGDGSAAGLNMKPTEDCSTFGKAGPGGPDPALCCQNNVTDPKNQHGYPFEVEAGGQWVLAVASVTSQGSAPTVQLTPLQSAGELSGRVRYAWQNYPLCVLANEQGLPLPPYVK